MFESRSKLTSGRYRYRGEPAPGGSVGFRRTGLAAFTLLELLVVVFIVGVLAALFSTAFNNTRARGHRISCINNLRQMQYAWRLYVDENLDMLPLNKSVDGALPERFFGRPNSPDSWVVGTPKADITPDNL